MNSDETFIITPTKNELTWNEGPTLKYARNEHTCGILKKKDKKYIVVFGGIPRNMTNKCEYIEIHMYTPKPKT